MCTFKTQTGKEIDSSAHIYKKKNEFPQFPVTVS